MSLNIADIPRYLLENQVSFSQLYFQHLGTPHDMIYQRSWGHELELGNYTKGKFSVNKNKIEIIQSNHERYFPALSIPYKDKDEMVMPYHHYELMKRFINSVEDLYLIGWKGNEAAFNNLIKSQAKLLKRIIIVNPNPNEVEMNLNKYVNIGSYERIYFKDFESFSKAEIT